MHYTLIFLIDRKAERVLLMKKNRGPYPNALNGIGGRIEPGESPGQCAARETMEEVQTCVNNRLRKLVTLEYPNGNTIHAFFAQVDPWEPRQAEDEPVAWFNIDKMMISTPANVFYFPGINGLFPLAGDGEIPYLIQLAKNIITGNSLQNNEKENNTND